jgi:hypothetical protein
MGTGVRKMRGAKGLEPLAFWMQTIFFACFYVAGRCLTVQARLDNTNAVLAASRDAHVPRVHLLEHEYLQSATAAELSWVRQVIADLDSGLLWWEQ